MVQAEVKIYLGQTGDLFLFCRSIDHADTSQEESLFQGYAEIASQRVALPEQHKLVFHPLWVSGKGDETQRSSGNDIKVPEANLRQGEYIKKSLPAFHSVPKVVLEVLIKDSAYRVIKSSRLVLQLTDTLDTDVSYSGQLKALHIHKDDDEKTSGYHTTSGTHLTDDNTSGYHSMSTAGTSLRSEKDEKASAQGNQTKAMQDMRRWLSAGEERTQVEEIVDFEDVDNSHGNLSVVKLGPEEGVLQLCGYQINFPKYAFSRPTNVKIRVSLAETATFAGSYASMNLIGLIPVALPVICDYEAEKFNQSSLTFNIPTWCQSSIPRLTPVIGVRDTGMPRDVSNPVSISALSRSGHVSVSTTDCYIIPYIHKDNIKDVTFQVISCLCTDSSGCLTSLHYLSSEALKNALLSGWGDMRLKLIDTFPITTHALKHKDSLPVQLRSLHPELYDFEQSENNFLVLDDEFITRSYFQTFSFPLNTHNPPNQSTELIEFVLVIGKDETKGDYRQVKGPCEGVIESSRLVLQLTDTLDTDVSYSGQLKDDDDNTSGYHSMSTAGTSLRSEKDEKFHPLTEIEELPPAQSSAKDGEHEDSDSESITSQLSMVTHSELSEENCHATQYKPQDMQSTEASSLVKKAFLKCRDGIIKVKHSSVKEEEMVQIADGINSLEEGLIIKKFQMRNCGLTPIHVDKLLERMKLRKVIRLDLSGNDELDRASLESIMEKLQPDSLDLSDCKLDEEELAIFTSSQVKEISLNYGAFSAKSFQPPAIRALSSSLNNGLKKLLLVDASINSDHLVQLASNLQQSVCLECLDLSCNKLVEEGMKAVARIANQATRLDSLHLCNCCLTTGGLQKFHEVITAEVSMLDLSSNDDITIQGWVTVADIARKCRTKTIDLTSCDLEKNKIDVLSSQGIQVQTLILSDNPLTGTSVGKLAKIWKVEHLDLVECGLSTMDIKKLCEDLEDHKLKTLALGFSTESPANEKVEAIVSLSDDVKDQLIVRWRSLTDKQKKVLENEPKIHWNC